MPLRVPLELLHRHNQAACGERSVSHGLMVPEHTFARGARARWRRRTLTANFRWGKCMLRFLVFSSTRALSWGDRRRRMARVCFGRRSRGAYFLFL